MIFIGCLIIGAVNGFYLIDKNPPALKGPTDEYLSSSNMVEARDARSDLDVEAVNAKLILWSLIQRIHKLEAENE